LLRETQIIRPSYHLSHDSLWSLLVEYPAIGKVHGKVTFSVACVAKRIDEVTRTVRNVGMEVLIASRKLDRIFTDESLELRMVEPRAIEG
jgi:hypothetical protein